MKLTTPDKVDTQVIVNPFSLGHMLEPTPTQSKQLMYKPVEKALGLSKLAHWYDKLEKSESAAGFIDKTLQQMHIRCEWQGLDIADIPQTGPLVVVANHPFGAIEGLFIARLLLTRRPDVKVMANGVLKRIPELSDIFLGVDPYASQQAAHNNQGSMRKALKWLRSGGVLVVFPAGDVSRWWVRQRCVVDGEWNSSVARLARVTKANVLPVYFHGRNSLHFHAAELLHENARSVLLARELINKRKRKFSLTVGDVITPKQLSRMGDDDTVASSLRLRTYALGYGEERLAAKKLRKSDSKRIREDDIIHPIHSQLLAAEIACLPENALLAESGALQAWVAEQSQIPWMMREIGRLREITFREVGEGSGKACDLDKYDAWYQHLFIWDKEHGRLVGAYRLGRTDEIREQHGLKGLYSHSLFRYPKQFLNQMGPALELGRSFIREEYQRSYAPLMLLWKGIGHYVVQHPKYANLFGPVSISAEYRSVSQQLLVDFLRANNFDDLLGKKIKPRHPYRDLPGSGWSRMQMETMPSTDVMSNLLSVIEDDNKGVPVLLRQYLKMGGRLLGFNVDPDFNHCVDGLIYIDLRSTEPTVLKRYMGDKGIRSFIAYHMDSTVSS